MMLMGNLVRVYQCRLVSINFFLGLFFTTVTKWIIVSLLTLLNNLLGPGVLRFEVPFGLVFVLLRLSLFFFQTFVLLITVLVIACRLAVVMKRCKKLKSELPDCIISYIFSKLALKDLVKTSALSKGWIHEWGLRTDLNFDPHTMFDYNIIQDLPNTLPLFQRFHFQSQFAARLDQFTLHYKGVIIRSIRVKFPLGNEHRDAIDRLISKGIAKGVKHIELLLSSETNDTSDSISPYKFPLTLLSDNNFLTYLPL